MPPLPRRQLGFAFNTISKAENANGNNTPVVLEVFVDFTCPYSKRMFDTLINDVQPYYGNKLNIIIPGTTPLVTMSANESNCVPKSPETFSKRAKNPSKKSKKTPNTTNSAAISKTPCTVKIVAIIPQKRLPSVNKLGICFFIINWNKKLK